MAIGRMSNQQMTNLTEHPDLIVERMGNGWTLVRLNRPKSLHALDEALAKREYGVTSLKGAAINSPMPPPMT